MADEAKIKVTLEGIEEAKAKAASVQQAKKKPSPPDGVDDDGDDDDGPQDHTEGFRGSFRASYAKTTKALIAKHKKASQYTSQMAQMQLQQGISQMRSGSPMGMLMGGYNLASVSASAGGIRGAVGGIAGRGASMFMNGGMLMRGGMIGAGIAAAGSGAQFLSDRGLGGGGQYNPIELAAQMKRYVDKQIAGVSGRIGGSMDLAKADIFLDGGLSRQQHQVGAYRAGQEKKFDEVEEQLFGQAEKTLAFQAEVAAWQAAFLEVFKISADTFKSMWERVSSLGGGK